MYLLFIYLFLFQVFFFFFLLYGYNQWRSIIIFTIETTQRWIHGIAVLCKVVVF